MYNSKISGLGMYVPENVVTNDDLSKIMDTSSEWIIERTGIKERRHIKKGEGNTTSVMGVKAAEIAMKRAIQLYSNKKMMADKIATIMKLDFSWEKSAIDYLNLYSELASK